MRSLVLVRHLIENKDQMPQAGCILGHRDWDDPTFECRNDIFTKVDVVSACILRSHAPSSSSGIFMFNNASSFRD